MDLFTLKTWLVFYLLSFAALLWAVFLSSGGMMLGISLLLIILVVGVNFGALFCELQRHKRRKALMSTFSRDALQVSAAAAGPGR
jgi:Flp pilus assembly protein TadB